MSRRKLERSRKTGSRRRRTVRKKSYTQKRRRGKFFWLKVLSAVMVLVLISAGVVYYKVRSYLHSEAFRTMVATEVGAEIGAEGEFGEFLWDGLKGETSGYHANGEGAIQSVDITPIHLDVDLDLLKRDAFYVKHLQIHKFNTVVDLQRDFIKFEKDKRQKTFLENMLPDTVVLQETKINSFNSKIITPDGEYQLENVGIVAQQAKSGQGLDVTAEGGRIVLPTKLLNAMQVRQVKLKVREQEVYLNHGEFSVQGSGRLLLSGFADLSEHSANPYEITGKLSHLRCRDVFPPNWQKNLKGEVVASFQATPYREKMPKLNGHLAIKNGQLEALPILNKIAYYLADSRYRTMRFQKFECDVEQYSDTVVLSNIMLDSKGLVKIEGRFTKEGEQLNGEFYVGLPPEKLTNIPGAETHVFLPGKENMNWTKVKIWGTVDNMKEDLSGRLLTAAGKRMIEKALEMGGEVMKPERIKDVQEGAQEAVGSAYDVLKGEKSVQEGVTDGLNSLLGNKTSPKEENPKEEEDSDAEKDAEEEEEDGFQIPIPDPKKLPDLLPFP